MNSNIISLENYKKIENPELKENSNIFIEMKTLGIDPIPFIEIAALDLHNQYGSSAIKYSQTIINDFQNDMDFESTEIWLKILTVLEELEQSNNALVH